MKKEEFLRLLSYVESDVRLANSSDSKLYTATAIGGATMLKYVAMIEGFTVEENVLRIMVEELYKKY
jgi:hypothetical protein